MNDYIKKRCSIVFLRTILSKFIALFDILVSFINILRIVKIAKSHKVNLIHINTAFVLEGILAARILKVPCIVHVRGYFRPEEKHILNVVRLISHMICVSKAVANSEYAGRTLHSKRTTIYDPVDLKLFDGNSNKRESIRRHWNLREEDIAVGIFGRVVQWKGQLEFVRAILNVMKVKKNVRAFIVGDESDGPVEYFNQIKEIINNSDMKASFILTGYQEDVEAYYFAMDIVVHASIEPEPFGMVVPEGMAAKKPLIAMNAGGPPEVINPGVDGILITPGDIEGMTAAILELANDPIKRQVMGLNGYNKARERFTIQSIASEVESVYKKLLSI